MGFIKLFYIILTTCLTLSLLFTNPLVLFAGDAPIHIEANSMTSTERTNSVVFIGDVDARQADVRIRSDKMTVYYTETGKEEEQSASQQVDKLVCIGHVEITRGEWLGTSNKMTYLSKERQVILTENAKAWQNKNMVSGEKITYFLDEGRSEVVGGTNAVIGTQKDKGQKSSRVNMTILQK